MTNVREKAYMLKHFLVNQLMTIDVMNGDEAVAWILGISRKPHHSEGRA